MIRRIFPIIICAILEACSTERPLAERVTVENPPAAESQPTVRTYSYVVIEKYPHDLSAFTQGLVLFNGVFLESTGQYGQSSIRRVDIRTGKVKKIERLDDRYFGEGMTVLNGAVYMITWLNQTGIVFDPVSLKKIDSFSYAGEGWGLTNDGTNLIMSNGSHVLSVIDPKSHAVQRSIAVTLNGSPVGQLNELEWIEGEIWANVWRSDRIVSINPTSGQVTGMIDLTGLLPDSERRVSTDVLNGIAYNAQAKAIYITGKNWPHVYLIKIQ